MVQLKEKVVKQKEVKEISGTCATGNEIQVASKH